jgi:hypothetical protein
LDPLVPNQVRYQTAPHSDKKQIIACEDAELGEASHFFALASCNGFGLILGLVRNLRFSTSEAAFSSVKNCT